LRPSIEPKPVTTPSAGDLLVGHPQVGAAVLGEEPLLAETAGVQQDLQALSGRELSFCVLLLHPLGPAALLELLAPLGEDLQALGHGQHRILPFAEQEQDETTWARR